MKLFKSRKTDEVEDILQILAALAKEDGVSLSSFISRLLPDNPIKSGVDVYRDFILDQYSCPNCKRPVGDEMMVFNYCPGCGKAINK